MPKTQYLHVNNHYHISLVRRGARKNLRLVVEGQYQSDRASVRWTENLMQLYNP